MTHWDAIDLDDGQNYVLNRAPLYRDRRDFVIQTGDTGKREDYPPEGFASCAGRAREGASGVESARSISVMPILTRSTC